MYPLVTNVLMCVGIPPFLDDEHRLSISCIYPTDPQSEHAATLTESLLRILHTCIPLDIAIGVHHDSAVSYIQARVNAFDFAFDATLSQFPLEKHLLSLGYDFVQALFFEPNAEDPVEMLSTIVREQHASSGHIARFLFYCLDGGINSYLPAPSSCQRLAVKARALSVEKQQRIVQVLVFLIHCRPAQETYTGTASIRQLVQTYPSLLVCNQTALGRILDTLATDFGLLSWVLGGKRDDAAATAQSICGLFQMKKEQPLFCSLCRCVTTVACQLSAEGAVSVGLSVVHCNANIVDERISQKKALFAVLQYSRSKRLEDAALCLCLNSLKERQAAQDLRVTLQLLRLLSPSMEATHMLWRQLLLLARPIHSSWRDAATMDLIFSLLSYRTSCSSHLCSSCAASDRLLPDLYTDELREMMNAVVQRMDTTYPDTKRWSALLEQVQEYNRSVSEDSSRAAYGLSQ